jgi:tRNA dimethylallyltransferase
VTIPAYDSHIPTAPDRSTRVLVVVGPTAVGKTLLAEEISVRRGGEIVSADSMQVYRGMNIGTAKPSPADRRVPYHCVDLREPVEPFSAALYQQVARAAIAEIAGHGQLPVVAGGTGLYVRAAIDDWHFPESEQADNPVRARYETLAKQLGPERLHELLAQRDRASAELLHPNNVRRVVRALEMLEGGTSYAEQHTGFSAWESVYDVRMIGLVMERSVLYERIDRRVDVMMTGGLLDEVESLLAAGMREALTAQQAIGYKELVPVIEQGEPLERALDAIRVATRRYAKRQLTWFRADPRIRWIDASGLSPNEVTEAALAAIDWPEAE